MRSFKLFLGIILLSIFTFSACNENASNPESVNNDKKSLAKDPAEIQQIISYLQQNNIEHAAFFFDVSNLGFGLGYVDFVTGENALFVGTFGNGDFLRMNPDGTYSVKLNTNQADAYTGDFVSGTFYACTGTAHMNYKFSGTSYDIDPNFGLIMFPDTDLNAAVLQGHATVYDLFPGVDPNPHTVHMQYVSNPGGQSHFKVTFN